MQSVISVLKENKRACIHCKMLFVPINYHQRVCNKTRCPILREQRRLRSRMYRYNLSFEDKFIRMIKQNIYNFSSISNSWLM